MTYLIIIITTNDLLNFFSKLMKIPTFFLLIFYTLPTSMEDVAVEKKKLILKNAKDDYSAHFFYLNKLLVIRKLITLSLSLSVDDSQMSGRYACMRWKKKRPKRIIRPDCIMAKE